MFRCSTFRTIDVGMKIIRAGVLILAAVLISSGDAFANPVDDAVKKAQLFIDQHKYQQAISCLDEAIDQNPNAREYVERARAYGFLNDQPKAFDDATKAIALDPKLATAYNVRGANYFVLKQWQNTVDDCSKAITLDPKLARAYTNRGYAYNELGQYQKAIDDCDQSIRLDPKMARAYSHRAVVYAKHALYEKAINDFNTAIALDPNDPDTTAYSNRIYCYVLAGKYQQAVNAMGEFISHQFLGKH